MSHQAWTPEPAFAQAQTFADFRHAHRTHPATHCRPPPASSLPQVRDRRAGCVSVVKIAIRDREVLPALPDRLAKMKQVERNGNRVVLISGRLGC